MAASSSSSLASPTRLRGLALLLVVFAAGAAAGAAADRAYVVRGEAGRRAQADSARIANFARHGGNGSNTEGERNRIAEDQIPTPLYALGLTADEETRLRAVALRWRPQALGVVADMRTRVSDLENGMFAEMLCVITPEQQRAYEAMMKKLGIPDEVATKRFALVRSNRCPKIAGTAP